MSDVASVFLPGPDVVHFYDYGTGVSFELPPDFQPDADGEPDAETVTYRDDDEQGAAVIVVQRVAGIEGEDGFDTAGTSAAVRGLADGMASALARLDDRRSHEVDGAEAITITGASPDGRSVYATVLGADATLWSVVASVPSGRAAALRAVLDRAVASIRLIQL